MTPTNNSTGRYLLFLDILGFSELVETKGVDEIYQTIDKALAAFNKWEDLNRLFSTIYFSDTFLFYQLSKGYGSWAFLDVYAIGGMLLSALLAQGVPARGTISFGEFEVKDDQSGRHQLYFGRALIDAYKAEQRENWIGITILESAWSLYERDNPGTIAAFERERVWKKRSDGVLLLNPFIKLRVWYEYDMIGEVSKPYLNWDAPEFPNDIQGFKYIRDKAAEYANNGDFSGKIATKYHCTIAFLRDILGSELFEWGVKISEEDT